MSKFLIGSLVLLAIVAPSFQQILFNGTWLVYNRDSSYCPYPDEDMYLKINETNSTTHEVEISYYNSTGTKFSGVCTAVSSSVNCGKLTTILNCPKNNNLFANLTGTASLVWDSMSDMTLQFNVPLNLTTGIYPYYSNHTCVYTANKFRYKWKAGDWVVTNCSCDQSCCYQPGTILQWRDLDDYHNRPYHNLSGSLRGGYWCNNTLSTVDKCHFTSSSSFGNYTINNFECDYMGCRSTPKAVYFNNYTAALTWDTCVATLSLVGAPNAGERMGTMFALMIAILALLNFFN